VHDSTLLTISRNISIKILSTQDVLFQPISIKNHTRRWIIFILHNSTQNLEDGRDTRPTTNHFERAQLALFAANNDAAVTEILKSTRGTLAVDLRSDWERIESQGHFSSWDVVGWEIDLYK
jgi:hypothetical protein